MNEQDLRQELVEIGRRVVAAGLVVGAGGNLSARLPQGDGLLITPSGHRLEDVEADSLVVLGLDGRPRGDGLKPSSEWAMHVAALKAREDAIGLVHVHPPYATLLHALDREIRLITIDHAYYVRRLAQVGYHPSGTAELADAVAAQLEGANVVLLKHHGCLVVAESLDLAFHRALNVEEAARATYRALLLGDTATACPAEYLERVTELESSESGYVYGQR